MATLFVDGFDHYGVGTAGVANMLLGVWAQVSSTTAGIGAPSWGARTGANAYFNVVDPVGARLVLPATKTNFFISMGYSIEFLPPENNASKVVSFRNGANAEIMRLVVESTGALSLYTGSSTLLLSTDGPVIGAGTWYHFEMQYQSNGAFQLNVNEVDVLSGTGLGYADDAIAQVAFVGGPDQEGVLPASYMDDLIIRDTTGSFNNSFEGDLRVATLLPAGDEPGNGWGFTARHKFGAGILDTTVNTSFEDEKASLVTVEAVSSLQLEAADYTLEMFLRIGTLPAGSNYGHIMGQWASGVSNALSYQLRYTGAGNIELRYSTDGSTPETLLSWPWSPETDTWHHIAVSRASAETMLFIDGIQQGPAFADANSYFTATTLFTMGGEAFDSGTTWLAAWYDEVRVTNGFARYLTNFTPPIAAFPRGSSDPHWAQVTLLCGFDAGIEDESSFAHTMVSSAGAQQDQPNDGSFAYQSINKLVPFDDTFIYAALLDATNIYTQTAQPTDGETVTVGTKDGTIAAVYTYKNALTTAFQVKIGTDLNTTLANLTAAINAGTGSGTAYGTGTTANNDVNATQLPVQQIEVTANLAGTGGNAIASTTTAANGAWDSATLTGGAGIPAASKFSLTRPPNNTTVIASVSIVSRQYKTDSGTCQTQVGFVGPLGTVSEGALYEPAVNASYHIDTFETDPDTGDAITPSTVIGGMVQVNRTE